MERGYLEKKGGRWRMVRLLDVVTLLHNIVEGARHPIVGHEDAARTHEQLLRGLNRKQLFDPAVLESALWSANLMDEAGEFWDVKGRTFDEFVKDVLGHAKFDRTYNVITDGSKK